jgi:hypothetical protein
VLAARITASGENAVGKVWKHVGALALILVAAGLGACSERGLPRPADSEPVVDVSGPATELEATVSRLRAEADGLRHGAERRFEAEKKVCYTRFFVNGCIADAKDLRLAAIYEARTVERAAATIERELRRRRFEEKPRQ